MSDSLVSNGPAGATAGMSKVLAYNSQPVQVQYDHQEVLDGKETQHLVEDSGVGHDDEPDHQKRPVLNEQGLGDVPHVGAVFSQEGRLLDTRLVLTARLGANHF